MRVVIAGCVVAGCLGCVVLVTGCASSSASRPAAAVQWFDGSLVKPPARCDWECGEEGLLQRVGHADVAAVGRIELISDVSFYERERGVGIAFLPEDVIHGSLDGLKQDGTVTLAFDRPEDAEALRQLAAEGATSGRFLLFALRATAGGSKRLHWVLYQPSDALVRQVRGMYRWISRR